MEVTAKQIKPSCLKWRVVSLWTGADHTLVATTGSKSGETFEISPVLFFLS